MTFFVYDLFSMLVLSMLYRLKTDDPSAMYKTAKAIERQSKSPEERLEEERKTKLALRGRKVKFDIRAINDVREQVQSE
jgi:hypothetical protein